MIDAATFFFSALLVSRLRVEEAPGGARTTLRDVREGFASGIRYALSGDRFLLVLLCIGAMMNFVMVPLNVLGTPYVMDSLVAGPATLSAVQLALVAGMALGAFATPKLRLRGRTLFLLAGLLCAASLAALGPRARCPPLRGARRRSRPAAAVPRGGGWGGKRPLFLRVHAQRTIGDDGARERAFQRRALRRDASGRVPLFRGREVSAGGDDRAARGRALPPALPPALPRREPRPSGGGRRAEDASQAPETSDFS